MDETEAALVVDDTNDDVNATPDETNDGAASVESENAEPDNDVQSGDSSFASVRSLKSVGGSFGLFYPVYSSVDGSYLGLLDVYVSSYQNTNNVIINNFSDYSDLHFYLQYMVAIKASSASVNFYDLFDKASVVEITAATYQQTSLSTRSYFFPIYGYALASGGGSVPDTPITAATPGTPSVVGGEVSLVAEQYNFFHDSLSWGLLLLLLIAAVVCMILGSSWLSHVVDGWRK